ncbi:MAG: hypothetical protein IT440_09015 [Phycisphaeraceae bacterium]|nr:hypothetical protein [Phycisphaeraceae bacterium]
MSRAFAHRRGVVAILAMMFLVIFGSLAAAMAIIAQGNLATADTHLKVNRSLAAAETGLHLVAARLDAVTASIKTRSGVIDDSNAPDLWLQVRENLLASFAHESHNLQEPRITTGALWIGPIAVGPGAPRFTASLQPHPLPGENYNAAYYQRPPYSAMNPPVSAGCPLGPTWIRLRVTAADGSAINPITRGIQIDLKLDKKIPYAILARSRVMIGRHVMVQGPIGSRFNEVNLPLGHPIQMVSDFSGLSSQLDDNLELLAQSLHLRDADGDNRLNLANAAETADLEHPEQLDLNHDGHIDDYAFFLEHYDANRDGQISATELDATHHVEAAQLLSLIDTMGDPARPGYNDGVIDDLDRYAKVRGQIALTAGYDDWNQGAAEGNIQNAYRGPVQPDYAKAPLTFDASDPEIYDFMPADFDISSFRNVATGNLDSQATQQAAMNNPNDPASPQPLGNCHFESVPYGAAHPYDYYNRPVYENMTFTNVRIPKGCNALFRNCTFIGATFVETTTTNTDSNFNYVGMAQADGSLKHPGLTAVVGGNTVSDTKSLSNNLRFDGCTFEGAVVTDAPQAYAHVRNKIAFTGRTRFNIDQSIHLTDSEKSLYRRSTLLMPHYSVEMGTFVAPSDPGETVRLSGTIVAGVIDIRGQVHIDGTILTTFEPVSGQSPVVGQTSPQFNTTLGYFPSSDGDLEAELPGSGMGVIQIIYNPNLALPDGILSPIQLSLVTSTYFEGGM